MARRAAKKPAKKQDEEPEKRGVETLDPREYMVEITAVTENMDPENVLPEQLFHVLLELSIAAAHERRCESEWFLHFVRDCFKARSLVAELRAETSIAARLDLPLTPEQRNTLNTAAKLTNMELVNVRGTIHEKLKLMCEMKPSPTTPVS